jgi:hypothetical protein
MRRDKLGAATKFSLAYVFMKINKEPLDLGCEIWHEDKLQKYLRTVFEIGTVCKWGTR